MIKREQIPTAAISGMKKSHRWSSFWSDDEAKDLVAAAINAWPDAEQIFRSEDEQTYSVILNITQEKNDE